MTGYRIGHRQPLPVCPCCRETIQSELYLDLRPFGVAGAACEYCVHKFMGYTQDLEDQT